MPEMNLEAEQGGGGENTLHKQLLKNLKTNAFLSLP